MNEQRIRFRDVKPCERVDALEELQGRSIGELTLLANRTGPFSIVGPR